MAKTQEELNTLKVEYEILNNKLKELTEDELGYVIGGVDEFPEAEDLQLTGPEKKELERKNDKENGTYN